MRSDRKTLKLGVEKILEVENEDIFEPKDFSTACQVRKDMVI